MPDFQISRVMACRCAEHAWVHLDDRAGRETAKVQVPIATGRSLAGMLGGRTTKQSPALDLVAAILVALDARHTFVSLSCHEGQASEQLHITTVAGIRSVPTDLCTALLAARHLTLPIRIELPTSTGCHTDDVPAAFRSVIHSLDLSGLGHEG